MDLNSIKDAFDSVIKKQTHSTSKLEESIDQITQEINLTLTKIQSSPSQTDHKSIIGELKTKLRQITPPGNLEATQKDLNIALNKYTKLLERQFIPDISKSYRKVDFDTHIINEIITSHFNRESMFEISDTFVNESHEEPIINRKTHFVELYKILESMKSRNLTPALNWATKNHEELEKNGSDIELKLHRLQFIEILQNRNRDEALKYSRTHFSNFSTKHFSEIQKLMACLLWAGKIDTSPYSEYLSQAHWAKLAHELAQQFCNLLGESYESPLKVTISAGIQGLPTLLKLMTVINGKKHEWNSMKQLPIPVDLGKELQFHSVFVCPVSRDQGSEDNPPMLMSCGHVLCKHSVKLLSMENSVHSPRPFKCPYCPTQIEVGQCRQLYF